MLPVRARGEILVATMADENSPFVYADGNPSRRPSNVAPIFTPARVVDARALAGLEFLRRPIPDVRAPHAGAPAFGGSDDRRGGTGDAQAAGSAFQGTAPPSGAKRPPPEDRARPHATGAGGFPDAGRGDGAKRRAMGPIEENKPPRGASCPSSPAPSGLVTFDGLPSAFDDHVFDDIDVDALVKQRQSSLPPAPARGEPAGLADRNRRGDAPNAPSAAEAPPLDGSGFEWRCEHGCALRDCAFLAAHARALGDVLLEVEFQLSDEDVVMSNKERRVLEARRAEGAEIVARAAGARTAPELQSMPPPPGLPQGVPPQGGMSTDPNLAYGGGGEPEAYRGGGQPHAGGAPRATGGAPPHGGGSMPPSGGSAFPPGSRGGFGGGGDAPFGGDRFGGGTLSESSRFGGNGEYESRYEDRPAPGDAAASIPEVRCEFVDHAIEKWRGETFPWSRTLRSELKNTFNARDFRGMQLATINCTLSGNDCLVLMPTGGGKSLCYQLPALVADGVTVVVSPLVSLIQDQLHHLGEMGIPAAVLGSAETEGAAQQNETYDRLYRQPAPDLKLLYLTPEKVARSGKLMSALERLHGRGMLARIVIDEVHCISSWGHDFRKDYKALRILKNQFPSVPVIGLTATATKHVQDDCVRQLGLRRCVRFFQSFNRVNIMYDVVPKGKSVVDDMLKAIGERHVGRQGRVASGIVYCFSQKDCETIAERLNKEMLKDKRRFRKPPACAREPFALPYHAGIETYERESNQQKWSDGKVPIICATVAFGMGINKPDVRFVFHHSIPKSLEAYHQESGRAGRDGEHSHCTLFYSYGDAQKAKAMLTDSAKKDGAPRAQLESNLDALNSLVAYCENASECRRTLLLRHFNETFDEKQCQGKCDVCAAKAKGAMFEERDVTAAAAAAARLLMGTASARGPACSMSVLADAFRGSRAAEILKRKYDRLDGYGGAKSANMKTAETHRLLRAMVMRGFFFEKSVRSDKGLYSALTHSVCADAAKCQDLFSGRATVSLSFQLDDKTAAYRRGEANERAHARREVPVAAADRPPASAAPMAPKADRVDVFAPATPEPVDDERYEALFDTMYQLRLAIAKRRKDDTGQHFAADRVVPLRLLESFARHPPPTFAALEREIAEKSFDIAEMVFLRTHKERVWKAIENGLARYRNEPEPHGVLVTPAPAARPPSIRSFEFNGTQPQPQWQRAGQGQG